MKTAGMQRFSLAPRFNAVKVGDAKVKPFKRLFSGSAVNTRPKLGVNEMFSPPVN